MDGGGRVAETVRLRVTNGPRGRSLDQTLLHQDVDSAPHSCDGQAVLRRRLGDQGQLRGDLATLVLIE
jgi:hypothetical protein